MKVFFEASYYDDQLDLNSEIYNALADIAFEYTNRGFTGEEIKAAFDRGLKWFDLHFWEDEELDESLKEDRDLSKYDHTIAFALNNNPDVKKRLKDICDQLLVDKISWQNARSQVIELFKSLDNVSDKTKKDAIVNLMRIQDNGRSAKGKMSLAGMLGTYMTGNRASV